MPKPLANLIEITQLFLVFSTFEAFGSEASSPQNSVTTEIEQTAPATESPPVSETNRAVSPETSDPKCKRARWTSASIAALEKGQFVRDRTGIVFQATTHRGQGQYDYLRRDDLADPKDFALSFLR